MNVTSAPLFSASAILAQTPCSNTASAVASRPSFRIRIVDGLRSPLVASKEWKSASRVTHLHATRLALAGECLRHRHDSCRFQTHVSRPTRLASAKRLPTAANLDQARCVSRKFEWLHASRPGFVRQIRAPGEYPPVQVPDTHGEDRPSSDRPASASMTRRTERRIPRICRLPVEDVGARSDSIERCHRLCPEILPGNHKSSTCCEQRCLESAANSKLASVDQVGSRPSLSRNRWKLVDHEPPAHVAGRS